ncbi:hypothetical protein BDW69DRAFT_173867, partial [Aspergillus filifer]
MERTLVQYSWQALGLQSRTGQHVQALLVFCSWVSAVFARKILTAWSSVYSCVIQSSVAARGRQRMKTPGSFYDNFVISITRYHYCFNFV